MDPKPPARSNSLAVLLSPQLTTVIKQVRPILAKLIYDSTFSIAVESAHPANKTLLKHSATRQSAGARTAMCVCVEASCLGYPAVGVRCVVSYRATCRLGANMPGLGRMYFHHADMIRSSAKLDTSVQLASQSVMGTTSSSVVYCVHFTW